MTDQRVHHSMELPQLLLLNLHLLELVLKPLRCTKHSFRSRQCRSRVCICYSAWVHLSVSLVAQSKANTILILQPQVPQSTNLQLSTLLYLKSCENRRTGVLNPYCVGLIHLDGHLVDSVWSPSDHLEEACSTQGLGVHCSGKLNTHRQKTITDNNQFEIPFYSIYSFNEILQN